ncbi:MAG: serine/threonine-protein kinase [Planctomycetota bacterium]
MSKEIGSYDELEILGKGAGSTIHRIRRHADGREYALKVIEIHVADDRKYYDQALHEFEIASQLRHRNIRIVHAFEKQQKLFRLSGAHVLMEYVQGKPLNWTAKPSVVELLRIFFRVADGLAHMHGRDFYHADIKPENIVANSDGDVKIIDLGLAWKRGEDKDRVQGTLEFLAPEQAIRKMVNDKTDIFNFGATMYRMFTGNPIPSQLRDPLASELAGVDKFVRPISPEHPRVPEDLDHLIRQCVRHAPDDRPDSMVEVRDRLQRIGKRLKKAEREG